MALIDFTLSNARRFYSSMGNPLGAERVNHHNIVLSSLGRQVHKAETVFHWCRLDNAHVFTVMMPYSSTISKTRESVSSGYPNTEKQMKAQGCRPSAFIVSRCLDIPMKHEAQVLEITSHDHSQTNHKQRLPIRVVCYLTFLPG